MSNMKREWDEEQERVLRQAGLTKETIEKINEFINANYKDLENYSCDCGCGGCEDADD